MHTILRLIDISEDFVTYAYGIREDAMIGTITISLADKTDCKFEFYKTSEVQVFNSNTGNAVTAVYRFIAENHFPGQYVYAC